MPSCRQVKTAPKRKPAVKDDEQEDDDDEEEDNKLKDHKPNNVSSKKKASGKAPKRSLTAAKDGPENSSKKANKNTDSDVDQVHENLQDKYYMHKYTARDLNNGGKGDLEGLVPYTIAQILEVETKMETSQGGPCIPPLADMDDVRHQGANMCPNSIECVLVFQRPLSLLTRFIL